MVIELTGWKGGVSGFGLRIRKKDRDRLFKGLKKVELELPLKHGNFTKFKYELSPSFWRRCPEVRSAVIREWMTERGEQPWPKGNPPKYKAQVTGNRITIIGGL